MVAQHGNEVDKEGPRPGLGVGLFYVAQGVYGETLEQQREDSLLLFQLCTGLEDSPLTFPGIVVE